MRDATLVLHDWGGPIGMGAAVEESERISRIVIANSVAFAPRAKRAFTRWHAAFASPVGQRLAVELNLVQLSATLLANRRPMPLRTQLAYMRPMRDRGARIAAARFVQMVPDGPDHPEAATMRAIEAKFDRIREKPMRVLWADRDPVMPPRLAERWLQPFPHATVERVRATSGRRRIPSRSSGGSSRSRALRDRIWPNPGCPEGIRSGRGRLGPPAPP